MSQCMEEIYIILIYQKVLSRCHPNPHSIIIIIVINQYYFCGIIGYWNIKINTQIYIWIHLLCTLHLIDLFIVCFIRETYIHTYIHQGLYK